MMGRIFGCGLAMALAAHVIPATAQRAAPTGASATSAPTVMGVGLTVLDLDRAIRFYRDGLGLVELTRVSLGNGTEVVLGPDRKGTGPVILLLRRDGAARATPVVPPRDDKVVLQVPDAKALAGRLTAAGYTPDTPKLVASAGVTNFFVTDPDGHRLEIVQLGTPAAR